MEARYFDALQAIRTTGKLEKETEEAIKQAINEVLQQFNAAL